ncbi:branched-chain amino acid ABC transporter permease, partial [Pseudomonas aeruginosa]
FSIAATFIALVAPLVRNVPTLVCVATSLFCSVLFSHWQWSSALVLAGLAGMAAGFVCNKLYREAPWSGQ